MMQQKHKFTLMLLAAGSWWLVAGPLWAQEHSYAPSDIENGRGLYQANCLGCHGVNGKSGMQTSHPERVSCTQCHAPSAELNQVPVGAPQFLRDLSSAGENGGE